MRHVPRACVSLLLAGRRTWRRPGFEESRASQENVGWPIWGQSERMQGQSTGNAQQPGDGRGALEQERVEPATCLLHCNHQRQAGDRRHSARLQEWSEKAEGGKRGEGSWRRRLQVGSGKLLGRVSVLEWTDGAVIAGCTKSSRSSRSRSFRCCAAALRSGSEKAAGGGLGRGDEAQMPPPPSCRCR